MKPGERLQEILAADWAELTSEQSDRAISYYNHVLVENELQNLTRLITPEQFYEGHVLDVRALRKSGLMDYPAMDLGSGVGVPGLLSGALWNDPWIVCDSEGRKAAFLADTVSKMGLNNVKAVSGRAENYLRSHSVDSICARAVSKVEKLFGFLVNCSTWNNLVLLKGPGWAAEWAEFQSSPHKDRLKIDSQYEYSIGAERKQRVIIKLSFQK